MAEIEEAQLLPALKAMDFFRTLKVSVNENVSAPNYIVGKGAQESTALRESTSITETDVQKWIQYWKRTGLF